MVRHFLKGGPRTVGMAPFRAISLCSAVLARIEPSGPAEAFGFRDRPGGICEEAVRPVRDFVLVDEEGARGRGGPSKSSPESEPMVNSPPSMRTMPMVGRQPGTTGLGPPRLSLPVRRSCSVRPKPGATGSRGAVTTNNASALPLPLSIDAPRQHQLGRGRLWGQRMAPGGMSLSTRNSLRTSDALVRVAEFP